MSKVALFVRHRTLPGRRDEFLAIWERYVKPRAEANPRHEAYYFCFADDDPDTVCVFQLYTDATAMNEFLSGDWYPEYLNAVGKVVASPPELVPAGLVWVKPTNP